MTAPTLYNDRGEPATRAEIEAAFHRTQVNTSVVVHVVGTDGATLVRLASVIQGVTADDVANAVIVEKETRAA